MEENLTADKEGVLDERVKEIEKGSNYVQIKITVPLIPDDVLREIGDKVSDDNNEIVFAKFLLEVTNYIEEHLEYNPIFNISGKNVSDIDRMIALAMAREMMSSEFINTYAETKNNDGGDE